MQRWRKHPVQNPRDDHCDHDANEYGHFDTAIALGIVLLLISFVINSLVSRIEETVGWHDRAAGRFSAIQRAGILDIPELQFAEGKRYGLIGENGSGKTTLLRLLAGTLSPTRGQVTRMGADGMGYMPQNPYAFSFSVLRNVEMALDGRQSGKRA